MNQTQLVTNSMLYDKLEQIEKLLKKFLDKQVINSIEEVSLRRASVLLKIGDDKIVEYIEDGHLKARKVKSEKAIKGYSYRLRLSDIREFQDNSDYVRNHETFDYKGLTEKFYNEEHI